MAAPTYVDSTGNTVAPGSGTSIVFAWSDLTGVATDDYAFALLLKESTAAFTATPSGWTQYHVWDQATGGFKYRAEVWRKRVSGDSGSITWSWSGSTWREGAMGVWRSAVTTEDPVLPTTPDEDIEASRERAAVASRHHDRAHRFGAAVFLVQPEPDRLLGQSDRVHPALRSWRWCMHLR